MLGISQAEPPTVLYTASAPCADHRYPRLAGDWLVVCDKRRRPTERIHMVTGERETLSEPHTWPRAETVSIPARAGTGSASTPAGLAWVADGPGDDADLWWRPDDTGLPRPLDVGPGDQHHPVSSGDWLAWVSSGQIKLWNTASGEQRVIDASTGFNATPSLYGALVCWETRGTKDIDIACSDGAEVKRPGHQTHPQRWRDTLIFRENGRVFSVLSSAKQ